eukprot:m.479630 g.479630  ORF g.479630 m.479630 type:complete len:163 (-) comp21535_c0_seq1:302-790(-)
MARQRHTRQPSEDINWNPVNPNESWINAKGFWVYYVLVVLMIHLILLAIPVFPTAWTWSLTNALHSVVTFFAFHWLKGTPFSTFDEGEAETLTQWEQIDHGKQFSKTKKFLIVFPIVLFLVSTMYTSPSNFHFYFNFAFMALVVVAKLPMLHNVRLFGINSH